MECYIYTQLSTIIATEQCGVIGGLDVLNPFFYKYFDKLSRK